MTNKSNQLKVIEEIKKKKLTVRETEKLVDKLLNENKKPKKIITVCKDLRIFTNTLNKTINEMKTAGLKVMVDKEEDDDYVEFKIRLPKKN